MFWLIESGESIIGVSVKFFRILELRRFLMAIRNDRVNTAKQRLAGALRGNPSNELPECISQHRHASSDTSELGFMLMFYAINKKTP